ncbi:MAG: hypothetical protein Q7S44_02140 [bacterium]|nr:hypothetical protein [bacterium]
MSPRDFHTLLRILLNTKLSNYVKDLVFLVLSFFATIFLVSLIDLNRDIIPDFIKFIKNEAYWPLSFSLGRVIIWIFVFLFLTWVWNLLKWKNKAGSYRFTLKSWPNDWIIQGGSVVKQNPPSLLVQMSESGCLLKKCIWKNFKMKFQMKFLMDEFKEDSRYNMRYLGVLLRALNLDSYYMLELIVEEGTLYAKPHVRYLGDWELINLVPVCKIDTNNFIKVKIEAKKGEKVELSINGESLYQWILPTHVDINFKVNKNGDGKKNSEEVNLLSESKLGDSDIIPEIPFRNNFGMIGFRAYPGQGAIIRSLQVDPI